MQSKQRDDQLVVTRRSQVSSSVIELTLERPNGERLPNWQPGAHIDLVLPSGAVRQYSLCGDRWAPHRYNIAIQKEAEGTGGSIEAHQNLAVGDHVGFGGPRNNFRLAPAPHYRFIAGGIGITAQIPMIEQAERMGTPWRLLYLGKSPDRMAYLHLKQKYADRVTIHTTNQKPRFKINEWVADAPQQTMVYCCGPSGMLDALPAECLNIEKERLRMERFTAATQPGAITNQPFDIHLAKSKKTLHSDGQETVVETLADAGIEVITSCSRGVCGTCELEVTDGTVDHRDAILDDDERAQNNCMFPCVSRALSKKLTLNL